MTKKKYTLTAEHKAQLKPWADKWIANALSTKPMDDYDREQMRIAIKGLYSSAGLPPPPDSRIVFVPSPFVARFSGGFAAAIWWVRKNKNKSFHVDASTAATAATSAATRDATYDATRDATYVATRAATYDATHDATRNAIDAATYDATDAATSAATRDATSDATYVATNAVTDAATSATRDATYATRAATYATRAATYAATRDATYVATNAVTDAATRVAIRAATDATDADTINKNWYSSVNGFIQAGIKLNLGKFGFLCADSSNRMYQGGNFWSGHTAFLSFFRHVVKLDIDYSKWDFMEKSNIHGSWRIMHPDFCIVSDRPRILKLDEKNRPHCENGPYCQWSDGMSLYAWHGVRIPEYWMTHKHLLTPEVALKWENVEQRRAACEIIGWNNLLDRLDAKLIDRDEDDTVGQLYEVDNEALGGKCKFLRMYCPTGRWFAEPVPPEMKTALEANSWGWDLPKELYKPRLQA